MTALLLALALSYDQAIVDFEPQEMRDAFQSWILTNYPEPQNALLRQLDDDGSGRCVRLCLRDVDLNEYN
jgi:hypothetical protein